MNHFLNHMRSKAKTINRKWWYMLFAVGIMVVLTVIFMRDKRTYLTLQGQTMGTTWLVKVVSDTGRDKSDLYDVVTERLAYVNQIASTYDRQSEISAFNASTSTDWIAVSPFMVDNVALAYKVWQMSDGRYDITIAPLIDLWGFDAKGRVEKMPDVFQLAQARDTIGMDKIAFRHNPPALKKIDPAVTINLSSIAKGAGIDWVVDALEKENIHNYLVEIGGEIRAKGTNDKGIPWTVGIEVPDSLRGTIQRAIQLKSNAIATSGDYRNYFEMGGKRYSHIIDPIRGVPINHKLASVSVFADSTAYADALATMLLVLGEEKGLAVAEKNGLAALFMVRQGNDFVEYTTTNYKTLYGE